MAGDDLSALLRCRSIVFGLCLGRHSYRDGAMGFAAGGRHHAPSFQRDGEDSAVGLARDVLFLRDRVVHGLVRGRSRRPFTPHVSVRRELRAALLDAVALQLPPAPDFLVSGRPMQCPLGSADLDRDQCRSVARENPHNLEYALARLCRFAVAAVLSDPMGLDPAVWPDRLVRLFLPLLRAVAAGGADERTSETMPRGARGMTKPLVAEF